MLYFYDLETTGLNPFYDKITEYCFIHYSDLENKVIEINTELVNPQIKLNKKIIEITKITDDMLADKKPFNEEVGQKLLYKLINNHEDKYFIAHNGDSFDRIFLKEHFRKVGIDLKSYKFKHIDTLLFARMMYPNLYRYSLGKLIEKFKIQTRTGHRAENDTMMLMDLYIYMCKDLSYRNSKNENYYLQNPQLVYDLIYH